LDVRAPDETARLSAVHSLKDHEQARSEQDRRREEADRSKAYRSIFSQLQNISTEERLRDEFARKRTGIDNPARIYGVPTCLSPAFHTACTRLWAIGSLPEGRADADIRRTYHLVARGRAPLSVDDIVYLGSLPETELVPLLGWFAHRMSLAEAQKKVATGHKAPPVTQEESA